MKLESEVLLKYMINMLNKYYIKFILINKYKRLYFRKYIYNSMNE